MGIIIAPIWLIAIIVIIVAFGKLCLLISSKEIDLKILAIGILFSLILIAIHLSIWKIIGNIWALAPAIILPITTIILPSILYFTLNNNQKKIKYGLLISAIVSGTLLYLFNDYVFDLSMLLGINTHY